MMLLAIGSSARCALSAKVLSAEHAAETIAFSCQPIISHLITLPDKVYRRSRVDEQPKVMVSATCSAGGILHLAV